MPALSCNVRKKNEGQKHAFAGVVIWTEEGRKGSALVLVDQVQNSRPQRDSGKQDRDSCKVL